MVDEAVGTAAELETVDDATNEEALTEEPLTEAEPEAEAEAEALNPEGTADEAPKGRADDEADADTREVAVAMMDEPATAAEHSATAVALAAE